MTIIEALAKIKAKSYSKGMTKREKIFLGVIIALSVIVVFGGGFGLASFLRSTQESSVQNGPGEIAGESDTPKPSIGFDASAEPQILVPEGLEKAKVKKVIDGDTVELEDGRTVRFIGIDTPETKHPSKGVECYGKEASEANRTLLEGKEVMLEKDVSETDRYQRLLRYVYVEDMMVNEYLVLQGFAFSSSYPPDVKHQERFVQAQKEAFEKERGLWRACKVSGDRTSVLGYATETSSAPLPIASATLNNQDPINNNQIITNNQSSNNQTIISVPKNSASTQTTSTATTKKEGCVIKGNISSGGKIYHVPGCNSYEKTGIDESAGERWFCSEDEAVAAGWRKAKNC